VRKFKFCVSFLAKHYQMVIKVHTSTTSYNNGIPCFLYSFKLAVLIPKLATRSKE